MAGSVTYDIYFINEDDAPISRLTITVKTKNSGTTITT